MTIAAPTGQFIPGSSPIHRADPRAKLLSLLILIAAVILSDTWVGCCLMLAFAAAAILLSRLPPATALAPVKRLLPFFVLVFMMNALFFSSKDPIWHWWIFTLSIEGMIQGASVAFRVLLIIMLSGVLTATTPPMELTGAIEWTMLPLKLLRVPVEEVAMILSVAIQFIPTLLEETDTIKKAQTARGARFESKRFRDRAGAVLPLVVPVFLSAFKRADELSVAMESRGYRGAKYRTPRERKTLRLSDFILPLVCALVCTAEALI